MNIARYRIEHVADYFPYGKILREFVESDNERYLTPQHERDAETGLDYRGARYYDSDIARFLSLDPLAAQFPEWSDYNYVMGNPILLVDPNGKSPQTTYVDKNGRVLDVVNDGSTDIVQFDDLDSDTWEGTREDLLSKDNGNVVGQTFFWHDFMKTDSRTIYDFNGPSKGSQVLNNSLQVGSGDDAIDYTGEELMLASTAIFEDIVSDYGSIVCLALLAKWSRNNTFFDFKTSLGHEPYTGIYYGNGVYTSLRVMGNITFGANMEVARNQDFNPSDKMAFWKMAMVYVGGYNMSQNNVQGTPQYPYYGEHVMSGRGIWLGYWGDAYPNK